MKENLRLSFFDNDVGHSLLDNISIKYLQKYYDDGGKNGLNMNGVHLFWKAMEKKFNCKIVFREYTIYFDDEKSYLAFVLKEM